MRRAFLWAAIATAGLSACWHAHGGNPAAASAPASAPAVTVERVRALVEQFRADPEFAPRRTEHHLRWNQERQVDDPRSNNAPDWLLGLVQWLAEGARWVVWLSGGLALALATVFAWRWIRVRADAIKARPSPPPSHVNALDIRPESLPADVAAAARSLLQRGDTRGALSLLYRGALSSLVHARAFDIRAASTEGECLEQARRQLPVADAAYFQRLVQAREIEVYADRRQPHHLLLALCHEFPTYFGAAVAPAGPEAMA